MTIEKILKGESKNTEFKVMLPKDSEKYTKSIIAFANTQGGQLIIGIDDKTKEIVGVDKGSVFQIMDSIANAVSDSCTPQIVPDITFQTIDGKTIVIASVAPGTNRPYFLKAKGKEKGTYIRVAGTSRQADPEKIKELSYEGARISWDELTCIGYPVTENAIKKLCRDINRYRKKMQEQKESTEKLPLVTRAQLVNWNVIKKQGGGYIASNAFALLTGKHFHYSRTQCAVFAGTARGDFLDKREYDGPLYEQIEEAYAFVMRNIRLSAKVVGLVRREAYEMPPNAIREMIINAHCHRNFLDPSCVQVALYDDRLEVTSPGGLCFGLTLEEALSGRSKQRNRCIAEVFMQMGLIEAWGTGLGNICRAAETYHLPTPGFMEMPETFRVNLYRSIPNAEYLNGRPSLPELPGKIKEPMPGRMDQQDAAPKKGRNNIGEPSEICQKYIGEPSEICQKYIGEPSEKYAGDHMKPLSNTQEKILLLLGENPRLSAAALARQIGISSRNIEANIKKLKMQGILLRHGSPKNGYWEIV